MSNKKQIYLNGLNTVRFIAAFLVILDHIELFKGYLGYKAFWSEGYSSHLGSLGVTIFFTLSGFLITYLLLQEKSVSNGNIDIRKFYIRRILRIWPLYYLIVIISFFIIPYFAFFDIPAYGPVSEVHENFTPRFLLFLFLLPNVAFAYLPIVPYGNVLWSVGVEEQFYLFWPWLVKKIRIHIIKIALACLIIYMIVRIGFSYKIFGNSGEALQLVLRTRFSCMLIGALAAGAIHIRLIKRKWVQWAGLLLIVAMTGDLINFPLYYLFKNEAQSVVVAILLINISMNKETIFKIENKLFNYLGKISYGLYVYHSIAAVIVIKLLSHYYADLPYGIWSVIILVLTTALTIVISHFSYFFFEKKLLDIKEKYSVVVSGDLVKK